MAEEGADDLRVRRERGEELEDVLDVRRRAAEEREERQEARRVVADALDALGGVAARAADLQRVVERVALLRLRRVREERAQPPLAEQLCLEVEVVARGQQREHRAQREHDVRRRHAVLARAAEVVERRRAEVGRVVQREGRVLGVHAHVDGAHLELALEALVRVAGGLVERRGARLLVRALEAARDELEELAAQRAVPDEVGRLGGRVEERQHLGQRGVRLGRVEQIREVCGGGRSPRGGPVRPRPRAVAAAEAAQRGGGCRALVGDELRVRLASASTPSCTASSSVKS